MEAWKVETQKKKVIYQERKKMFKDERITMDQENINRVVFILLNGFKST